MFVTHFLLSGYSSLQNHSFGPGSAFDLFDCHYKPLWTRALPGTRYVCLLPIFTFRVLSSAESVSSSIQCL